jgi:hypothetical protein
MGFEKPSATKVMGVTKVTRTNIQVRGGQQEGHGEETATGKQLSKVHSPWTASWCHSQADPRNCEFLGCLLALFSHSTGWNARLPAMTGWLQVSATIVRSHYVL